MDRDSRGGEFALPHYPYALQMKGKIVPGNQVCSVLDVAIFMIFLFFEYLGRNLGE